MSTWYSLVMVALAHSQVTLRLKSAARPATDHDCNVSHQTKATRAEKHLSGFDDPATKREGHYNVD